MYLKTSPCAAYEWLLYGRYADTIIVCTSFGCCSLLVFENGRFDDVKFMLEEKHCSERDPAHTLIPVSVSGCHLTNFLVFLSCVTNLDISAKIMLKVI